MDYDTFIQTIHEDLKLHYINFKFYAVPKKFYILYFYNNIGMIYKN